MHLVYSLVALRHTLYEMSDNTLHFMRYYIYIYIYIYIVIKCNPNLLHSYRAACCKLLTMYSILVTMCHTLRTYYILKHYIIQYHIPVQLS